MEYFGHKVYELRKENNMSQEKLAECIGVTRQTVSNWETGEAQPTLDKVKKLAELFEISIDALTYGENSGVVENGCVIEKYIGKKVIIYLKINMKDSSLECSTKIAGAILTKVEKDTLIFLQEDKQMIMQKSFSAVSGIEIMEEN